MKKILLGVTGSVAAKLTPTLVRELIAAGWEVRVVGTKSSFYFWKEEDVNALVYRDEDEWPGYFYEKDQPILHIDLREWADALLIAPLTANTLAKIAGGICDNLLTSIARAWHTKKPLVIAPAMNTEMWNKRITAKNLAGLAKMFRVEVVDPIVKKLACGDHGIGAMAEIPAIIRRLQKIRPPR